MTRIFPMALDQESSVSLRLPDGMPVMRSSENHGCTRMKPRSVKIEWTGSYDSGQFRRVVVDGRAIRRDGTVGVQRQSIDWYPDTLPYPGYPAPWRLLGYEVPDWLADLVNRYTPPRPDLTIGDLS